MLFLAGILLFAACQSSESNDQQDAETNVSAPPALALLFTPNTKLFRGVDFQTNKQTLLKTESAERVELADPNAEVFSIDLNEAEFADIRYLFNNDALAGIEVEIFAADMNSARAYQSMLEAHFNKKYQSNAGIWSGSHQDVPFSVIMSLIDSEEDPGITILWERAQ